jgi:hypothetical protein
MDSRVKDVALKSGYKLWVCTVKLCEATQQRMDE